MSRRPKYASDVAAPLWHVRLHKISPLFPRFTEADLASVFRALAPTAQVLPNRPGPTRPIFLCFPTLEDGEALYDRCQSGLFVSTPSGSIIKVNPPSARQTSMKLHPSATMLTKRTIWGCVVQVLTSPVTNLLSDIKTKNLLPGAEVLFKISESNEFFASYPTESKAKAEYTKLEMDVINKSGVCKCVSVKGEWIQVFKPVDRSKLLPWGSRTTVSDFVDSDEELDDDVRDMQPHHNAPASSIVSDFGTPIGMLDTASKLVPSLFSGQMSSSASTAHDLPLYLTDADFENSMGNLKLEPLVPPLFDGQAPPQFDGVSIISDDDDDFGFGATGGVFLSAAEPLVAELCKVNRFIIVISARCAHFPINANVQKQTSKT